MVRKILFSLIMCLVFTACSSPSKEGQQGRLRASLPVAAELIFE